MPTSGQSSRWGPAPPDDSAVMPYRVLCVYCVELGVPNWDELLKWPARFQKLRGRVVRKLSRREDVEARSR